MKKVLVALCTLVLATGCFNIHINGTKSISCKGPVVEKDMELSDFTAIVLNGSSDLTFSQADAFSVVVTANEEVFDHIDYKVENGVLVIGTKDGVNIRAERYDVAVTLPYLESITLNGAADINQKGPYVSDKDLKVQVNGAGDLNFLSIQVPSLLFGANGASDINASGLDVQNLTVSVNGAGDAVLSGKAASAVFSVNGAGDIDARELECGTVSTHKAGVASIRLK